MFNKNIFFLTNHKYLHSNKNHQNREEKKKTLVLTLSMSNGGRNGDA